MILYYTVCNYTCGPGEVVNATCNGCNLTDICLRDMPCQNGGSCILLSVPDNYTCNCSGTGYMGTYCNGKLLSKDIICCYLLWESYLIIRAGTSDRNKRIVLTLFCSKEFQ